MAPAGPAALETELEGFALGGRGREEAGDRGREMKLEGRGGGGGEQEGRGGGRGGRGEQQGRGGGKGRRGGGQGCLGLGWQPASRPPGPQAVERFVGEGEEGTRGRRRKDPAGTAKEKELHSLREQGGG